MAETLGIARGHVAIMLGLTGVRVEEVAGAREAEETLSAALESGADLVIVQEEFREGFSPWFRDHLVRRRGLPLVVYCPSFDTEDPEVDAYLSAVLKPAVGYEIRLE